MTTENDLESLLDSQATSENVEPAPQAETAPVVEPKGETAVPPAAGRETTDPGPMVPRAALEDERRKRQEYERKVGEYETWLRQQQTQQQRQQERQPEPDIWTEPDKVIASLREENARVRADIERQLILNRIEDSREVALQKYDDFEEIEKVFVEAANNAPHLLQAMAQHRRPAQFAYETGKRLKILSEIGDDPEAYIERRLAERLGQSQPNSPSAQAPSRSVAPVPKSLASRTSTPPPRNERGQFSERAPLEDLIG